MNSRNSKLHIKFRIRKAFVVRMLVLAVLPALLLSACALSRQGSAEEGGSPQYLLISRRSVYDTLCKDYPIYGRLKEMVDSPENHVFRIGGHAREFISGMEAILGDKIAQAVGF